MYTRFASLFPILLSSLYTLVCACYRGDHSSLDDAGGDIDVVDSIGIPMGDVEKMRKAAEKSDKLSTEAVQVN